jgi:hypothetical protein
MAGCRKQRNMIRCRAPQLVCIIVVPLAFGSCGCMLPETRGVLLHFELNMREIQLISLENFKHSVDSELLCETYVDGFDCFIIACGVDHNFIKYRQTYKATTSLWYKAGNGRPPTRTGILLNPLPPHVRFDCILFNLTIHAGTGRFTSRFSQCASCKAH